MKAGRYSNSMLFLPLRVAPDAAESGRLAHWITPRLTPTGEFSLATETWMRLTVPARMGGPYVNRDGRDAT